MKSFSIFTLAYALSFFYSLIIMLQRSAVVEKIIGGSPPDLWFGYSFDDLNYFYKTLGNDGCQHYIQMAKWDFFPFMPVMFISLNFYLKKSCEYFGLPTHFSLLTIVAWVADIIETGIQMYGCSLYPISLSPVLVMSGSLGNQLKWIISIPSIIFILFYFMSKFFPKMASKNE